ncbi:MAG: peptidoglycan DD-metalloendopeptidase family protein [Gemmatimonadaceae bacterium]
MQRFIPLVGLTILLAACGGGGTEPTAPVTPPVTVTPTPTPSPTTNGPQPFLQKPFTGEWLVYNVMDHDTPEEFIDTNGYTVSSWGERVATFSSHAGYDFPMPTGTPILAAASGVVTTAGSSTFFCPVLNSTVNQLGVVIRHDLADGSQYQTYYAHLSSVSVAVGQNITAGAQIGLSGNTGCTTLPHLHFQLDRITGTNNGKVATVDPYGWTGASTDPWVANPRGATSLNLWLPGKAPQMFIGLDPLSVPFNGPQAGPTKKPVGLSALRWAGVQDEINPNNEYVELAVDPSVFTGASYDLTGHYIKNNEGDRFNFPAGTMMHPGTPLRVYVGNGTNTATALYWGKSAGIFQNLGDCAQLYFPNGTYYLIGYAVSCR